MWCLGFKRMKGKTHGLWLRESGKLTAAGQEELSTRCLLACYLMLTIHQVQCDVCGSNLLIYLVRPTGLEPVTPRSVVWCSIH